MRKQRKNSDIKSFCFSKKQKLPLLIYVSTPYQKQLKRIVPKNAERYVPKAIYLLKLHCSVDEKFLTQKTEQESY